MKNLFIKLLFLTVYILGMPTNTLAQDGIGHSEDHCPLNGVDYSIGEKISIEIGDDIEYYQCVMSVLPMKQKSMDWAVEEQWPVWTPIKSSENTIINWF